MCTEGGSEGESVKQGGRELKNPHPLACLPACLPACIIIIIIIIIIP